MSAGAAAAAILAMFAAVNRNYDIFHIDDKPKYKTPDEYFERNHIYSAWFYYYIGPSGKRIKTSHKKVANLHFFTLPEGSQIIRTRNGKDEVVKRGKPMKKLKGKRFRYKE